MNALKILCKIQIFKFNRLISFNQWQPHSQNTIYDHHTMCRKSRHFKVFSEIIPDSKVRGPTWSPPGSCRPQMGPKLAPWTLLSGILRYNTLEETCKWFTFRYNLLPVIVSLMFQGYVTGTGVIIWLSQYKWHYLEWYRQDNDIIHQWPHSLLTLIPAWISNYIHYNVWDEITYPFLNFNGATVEV